MESLAAFKRSRAGFVLTEAVMAIAIMSTFFGLTLITLDLAYKTSLVRGSSDVIMSAIATANARAKNGLYGTNWGVYLFYDESTREADSIVVFSGDSYNTRVISRDIYYDLNPRPHIYSAEFSGMLPSSGNDHEIVFEVLTGRTSQYGQVDLAGTGNGVNVGVSPLGIPTRIYQ
jgi:type II secretory pathway pseudopilin PulG